MTGCSISRGYEALLVLGDLAAGTGPSRLKSSVPAPVRTMVPYPSAGTIRRGDLYLPGDKPLAAILLLPGAAEQGKDDPRLAAFAASLARARFSVLVPDMEGLRSLRVGSHDVRETVGAFAWLAARPDLAPQGKAGIVSFSYASGPALLAALDPQVANRVRFILAVGGYCSMVDVLTFFTTGYYRGEGGWRYREPNRYGMWVFVASNTGRLSDPADRRLIGRIAARKMAGANAPVEDLADRLGPEGRRLYAFIGNRDPRKAPLLVGQLPVSIRREITFLDLARYDLTRLRARVMLLHGYDDDIIPYTESIALARRLPPETVRLWLVHGLQHVDLEPGMQDRFRLWRTVMALLQERKD